MDTMTPAAIEITRLEALVLDAAQDLADALQELSDAYWVDEAADAPLFRCMPSTVETLDEVDNMLELPIGEIRAAV